MKKLSLQWRITLMTSLLIGITCMAMKLLLCFSGIHYMDSIGESLRDYTTDGEPAFFNPETADPEQDLTIVILGAQEEFCLTNWYITAAITTAITWVVFNIANFSTFWDLAKWENVTNVECGFSTAVNKLACVNTFWGNNESLF